MQELPYAVAGPMREENSRKTGCSAIPLKSSAAIYSLIQTVMENSLNPQAYLEYIFKQIQQRNDIDVGKCFLELKKFPKAVRCWLMDHSHTRAHHLMLYFSVHQVIFYFQVVLR